MGAVRSQVLLIAAVVFIMAPLGGGAPPADSLYGQSAAALFEREFPDRNLSYLLVGVRSGQLLASRWDDAALPIAVGSLVKPFLAVAYAEEHAGFPQYACRGAVDGCWLSYGHGTVGITAAIAHSCNAYFRALAKDTSESRIRAVVERYGAGEISEGADRATYIGLGEGWRMSPLQLAAAYTRLVRNSDQAGVEAVLHGMREAARIGTAQAIGRGFHSTALVKTGTAACSHAKKASGDGFVVVIFPAEDPRTLFLLRRHGSTGAVTAEYAAQMLHRLESSDGAR